MKAAKFRGPKRIHHTGVRKAHKRKRTMGARFRRAHHHHGVHMRRPRLKRQRTATHPHAKRATTIKHAAHHRIAGKHKTAKVAKTHHQRTTAAHHAAARRASRLGEHHPHRGVHEHHKHHVGPRKRTVRHHARHIAGHHRKHHMMHRRRYLHGHHHKGSHAHHAVHVHRTHHVAHRKRR